jgi:nucleoside phosphorylase
MAGDIPDREHERRVALGIVCALESERPRRIAGAVVAVGGPGRTNAARVAEKLAAERELSGLVSFGFAGALAPHLKIGDVVVDTCVPKWRAVAQAQSQGPGVRGEEREQTKRTELPDGSNGALPHGRSEDLPHSDEGRRGRLPHCHLHLGRIATVDRVIRSATERAELARETGALAVDMESDAIAAVAAAHGLPFCAVRAITDSPRHDLVIDWNRWRREDGGFRLLGVLGQAFASRQGMAEIAQLWYASRLASKHLRLFLAELISANGTLI